MDAEFWIKAWNEGRTNFHQQDYHEKLLEFFPLINPLAGQKVLVPLCGKTKDLIWLYHLKLKVQGIELYDQAVKSFFYENELSPVYEERDQDFTHFSHKDIVISCGDFFKFKQLDTFDFIYDRAALVALPKAMRKDYSQVIKQSLKLGGKYLLIVYEYDQSKLDGPPFSINTKEINELYENHFAVQLVDSMHVANEGSRFSVLENGLKQNVYILERIQ